MTANAVFLYGRFATFETSPGRRKTEKSTHRSTHRKHANHAPKEVADRHDAFRTYASNLINSFRYSRRSIPGTRRLSTIPRRPGARGNRVSILTDVTNPFGASVNIVTAPFRRSVSVRTLPGRGSSTRAVKEW